MAIDFSFLEGAAPQKEEAPVKNDTVNVTIRVDADCMLLCDGEYMDQQFKAGVITKIQLPTGQHLLEFLSEENPDVKVEKVVDFIEAGKSYLVMVNELKAALSKFHTDAAVALGTQKAYRLTITGYANQISAMMVARTIMGWSAADSREKLSRLPLTVIDSQDLARVEAIAAQFAKGGVNVSIETRNGFGELINTAKMGTAREIAAEEKQNDDVDTCIIPEGVEELMETEDFEKYYNGESRIIFPSTLKRLGENAENTIYNLLGDGIFPNESIKEVDLSKCVRLEIIGNSVFSHYKSLSKIAIPDSVKEIVADAFAFCSHLEEIVIPANVKRLHADAFVGCRRLRKVYFKNPYGISIGDRAFRFCRSLESFNADDGVTFEGPNVFEECDKLEIPRSFKLQYK